MVNRRRWAGKDPVNLRVCACLLRLRMWGFIQKRAKIHSDVSLNSLTAVQRMGKSENREAARIQCSNTAEEIGAWARGWWGN